MQLAARFWNYNNQAGTINLTPQGAVISVGAAGITNHYVQTMKANAAVWQNRSGTRYFVVESDYAGYAFSFASTAHLFHFGVHRWEGTNIPAALADYRARGLHAQYLIPKHAVKGYAIQRDAIYNSRLVSNPLPGKLNVDFGAARATLNLTAHLYGTNITGTALLSGTDFTPANTLAFANFVLSDFGNGDNSNVSRASNSNCAAAGNTTHADRTDATQCGGTFTYDDSVAGADNITRSNNAATANNDLDVNLAFYGIAARQIAGWARYVAPTASFNSASSAPTRKAASTPASPALPPPRATKPSAGTSPTPLPPTPGTPSPSTAAVRPSPIRTTAAPTALAAPQTATSTRGTPTTTSAQTPARYFPPTAPA